jgi:Cdc6-like AAA superfamily ATPase
MNQLLTLAQQAGTHGVIYGERGVGKTSLASVMVSLLMASGGIASRANCTTNDTYRSIWKKVLDGVVWVENRRRPGFTADVDGVLRSASELLGDRTEPGDVLRILQSLAKVAAPVVFLDEFDRVANPRVRAMFADTIKMLSDQSVDATIVLVGVADTIEELISEHASVERALVQIQMPRMSRVELEQIVARGSAKIGLQADYDAISRITQLSQGLPHYTHLLAYQSAHQAIAASTARITRVHVDGAVGKALSRTQQSIVNDYSKAISSPQRKTLYAEVLLASALAKVDALGYFAPGDVRQPLSAVLGKPVQIPSFVRHLHSFTEADRGEVLQKRGPKHRQRFRFRNPLLQPYVVMLGLHEARLTPKIFERFG